jgi:hypothetical protein
VVDCGGLENRCTFTGTVGSNPTASANYFKHLAVESWQETGSLFKWKYWLVAVLMTVQLLDIAIRLSSPCTHVPGEHSALSSLPCYDLEDLERYTTALPS